MKRFIFSALLLVMALALVGCQNTSDSKADEEVQKKQITNERAKGELSLLTDPFIQLPHEDEISIIWFTEFEGKKHFVEIIDENQKIEAESFKLSSMYEDQFSFVGEQTSENKIYTGPISRNIWRHEVRIPHDKNTFEYKVISVTDNDIEISSKTFNYRYDPGLILFTSDFQSKPMAPANIQKLNETFNGEIGAIFFAGDLIDTVDRTSEWFDDNRGNAFFQILQGNAHYKMEKNDTETIYTGAPLIQSIPIFTAIGNHEVMGRPVVDPNLGINWGSASRPQPKEVAQEKCKNAPEIENCIKVNSYNTTTYEEIFSLPKSSSGSETYYATTFGDVRLISLYATRMWRPKDLKEKTVGTYKERQSELNDPERKEWGYGSLIYEPIKEGSAQYEWLKQELESDAFKEAKYKIVMLHEPPHSVGGNIVPAFTDPVQIIEKDEKGNIINVKYEYPKEKDYLIHDLVPLLEKAGVQLVLNGHSHLWNRFYDEKSGLHFLETSNVGNTYEAFMDDKKRDIPEGFDPEQYVTSGDPYGLEPIVPTIAPLEDEQGNKLPYIASNDITVFTVFDAQNGVVKSYYYNTAQPDSEVVLFDEFSLLNN